MSILITDSFQFIGSGFSVHITLKESNLAPLYQAVDHADSNDNAGFHGDITIRQQYCPFPVPEKYQLSLILHQVCVYPCGTYIKLDLDQSPNFFHGMANLNFVKFWPGCGITKLC